MLTEKQNQLLKGNDTGGIKVIYGLNAVKKEFESIVNIVLTHGWGEVNLLVGEGGEELLETYNTAIKALNTFGKTAFVV